MAEEAEEVERHFRARVEGATCAARAPAARPAEAVAEVRVEEEVVVAVAAVVVAVAVAVAVVVVAVDEWGWVAQLTLVMRTGFRQHGRSS